MNNKIINWKIVECILALIFGIVILAIWGNRHDAIPMNYIVQVIVFFGCLLGIILLLSVIKFIISICMDWKESRIRNDVQTKIEEATRKYFVALSEKKKNIEEMQKTIEELKNELSKCQGSDQ